MASVDDASPSSSEVPPSTTAADEEGSEAQRRSRLNRLSRLWQSRRDLAEDTRELLSAVLETSDKAKSEMVRMVAREVRTYLDELRLKEELVDLATSHSLELQVSMSLKPLPGVKPRHSGMTRDEVGED